MPPNVSSKNQCVAESVQEVDSTGNYDLKNISKDGSSEIKNPNTESSAQKKTVAQIFGFKTELIWSNIILISTLHVLAVYYLFTFPYSSHKLTSLWMILSGYIGGTGVTGGVHRLWTHRSYKAKLPLRIILMLCYYSTGQNSIYDWVRDHRVHHKHSETDADPHNSRRGFFFAHVGWLMMQKHPDVKKHGKKIDMSDISNDPVVAFGEKYFVPLNIFLSFIVMPFIPVYFWNEEWKYALTSQLFIRYPVMLNFIWSVNSAAHIYGYRPYDKSIFPAENHLVSLWALGEGWHNYHHVFPWDYKTAEFGYYRMNWTTMVLDGFAKIGWAYDLKEPSPELVKSTMEKRGDGTRPPWYEEVPENIEELKKQQQNVM